VIFLDTNIILRAVTTPRTPQDQRRQQQALDLLERVGKDEVSATASEVVLHEIATNLISPRQYGLSAGSAIEILRDFLALAGLYFPGDDEVVYVRALDLWEAHPKLEFSDAVIAARCERNDLELASFDRHFDRLPGLRRWIPAEPDIETPPSQES
jgi:predicted nucleic acid-binding protein